MVFSGAINPPRRLTVRGLLIGLAFGLIGLLLLAFVSIGVSVFILILAGLVAATIAAWRWPIPTTLAFVAFIPVNRFVILLIFHFSGSPVLTKNLQLWKDGILLLLLARVVYETAFGEGRPRFTYLDLLVLFFVGFSAMYMFYPQPDLPLLRVQGFRSDAFFLIAYFVGRGLHLRRRDVGRLLAALIPGSVAVALVAAVQFAMPGFSNGVMNSLGYQEFVTWQGATGEMQAVRDRILTGGNLPRASSLLLGDLALAFYQVVLVALAAALFFEARSPRRRLWTGIFLTAMIGTLALTITRSAILAAIPVVIVTAILSRAFGKLAIISGFCLTLAVSGLLVTHIQPATLLQLVSPTESSTVAHENALVRSIDIIKEEPLGRGLGTAGTIGQHLFNGDAITNESWYLQLGTEMGVVSPLTYLLLIALVIATCFLSNRRLRDRDLRVLVLGTGGAALGFLIVSNFLHAWENTALAMLFWLFAGIAVRAPALDRAP